MTTMIAEFDAALAVVSSLRESAGRSLRRNLREESDAGLASRITDAMGAVPAMPRVTSYWVASGHNSIEAVRALTGVDEAAASLLVGASLHALVLAGADVNEANVNALAERAAAWIRGRAAGIATATVTA